MFVGRNTVHSELKSWKESDESFNWSSLVSIISVMSLTEVHSHFIPLIPCEQRSLILSVVSQV